MTRLTAAKATIGSTVTWAPEVTSLQRRVGWDFEDESPGNDARGYSVDNCEHEPDLRCVGAPIRNAAGRVFAAISASGPARRLPDERIPGLAEQVVAHAEAISARLGHVPGRAEPP